VIDALECVLLLFSRVAVVAGSIITLLRWFECPIPETDNPSRIHFHDYNSKIGAPKVVLYSKMFLVSQPLDQHDESLCMPTCFGF
jgi:hypothetical protein